MGDQLEPYVLIKKNGLTKPYKSISREEFQKFKKLNGLLRDFERTQGILPLVESNASALDNYVSKIEKQNHDLSIKRLEILKLNDEVNRKLLNFLASGRLYLDHTETRLKRSYGDNSKEAERFDSITSEAYDDFFAYRFFYQLRNYVQHCGMGIDFISNYSSSKRIPGHIDSHKINIQFSPKRLLQDFDGWKHVKNDLKKEGDRIDVYGFASEVTRILKEINIRIYLAELSKLQEAGNWIVDLVEDVFESGGQPQIATLDKNGSILNANILVPALDVIQVLGVINFENNSSKKSEEYFPMFGFCFKLSWNKSIKQFEITCPSVSELKVTDKKKEKVIDKAEVRFKEILQKHLEQEIRSPVPLPWRKQYKLIVGNI
ncbi:hypothetical protein [Fodinibius sp. Rm-B-1B1-1]|uniref:hypothetical protein n=1 Tax=Fodinibius alkaliphilus TaxID=3140241 RepID=UPI00315AC38C